MSNGTHYATELMNRMKGRKEAMSFHRGKLKRMHRTAFFVRSNRLLKKDISVKDLDLIKRNIRLKAQRETKKIRIIAGLLFLICGFVTIYFWHYIF